MNVARAARARAALLSMAALTTMLCSAVTACSSRPATPRRISYVALGDSYTAGPLIPSATGRPAGCLRSTHNYPHLVASALHVSSFTDASCQGATTASIATPESLSPLPGTAPPQLTALARSTTLVTLQIGGNDFEGIAVRCMTLSFTDPDGHPCESYYTRAGTDRLARAIAQTAPKVAAVLRLIHKAAPHARVLLLGYPVILPATGSGCWPYPLPVASGDVPYLRGVELKLNAMLKAQAAANGATYVDTYTDSIGHDACQPPGRAWVEPLIPTAPAGPLHPDAAGERAMAKQVLAALR